MAKSCEPMSFGRQMQVDQFRPSSHGVLMERLGRGSYPGLLAPRKIADWVPQAERGWKWSQRISVFPLIGCPTTRSLRPLTQPTGRLEGMQSSISMLVDLGIRRVT